MVLVNKSLDHTWDLSLGCAAEADTPPRDAVPTVHSMFLASLSTTAKRQKDPNVHQWMDR